MSLLLHPCSAVGKAGPKDGRSGGIPLPWGKMPGWVGAAGVAAAHHDHRPREERTDGTGSRGGSGSVQAGRGTLAPHQFRLRNFPIYDQK
jgi:hypothetical protein